MMVTGPATDLQGNMIGADTIPISMVEIPTKTLFHFIHTAEAASSYEALKKQGFKFINYEER